MRLNAARFASNVQGTAGIQDDRAFLSPAGIGIRWNIEYFGLQRLEITVKSTDRYDAHRRYLNHLGQRIGVYDHTCRRVISAVVVDVRQLDAHRVMYVGEGLASTYLAATLHQEVFSTSEQVGDATGAIADILQAMNQRIDNTDFSNIDSNSTTLGGWQAKHPTGSYTLELLRQLVDMLTHRETPLTYGLLTSLYSLRRWGIGCHTMPLGETLTNQIG